jgi:hypothetical protein
VAVGWGYVSQEAADGLIETLDALGGRLYGLSRR